MSSIHNETLPAKLTEYPVYKHNDRYSSMYKISI